MEQGRARQTIVTDPRDGATGVRSWSVPAILRGVAVDPGMDFAFFPSPVLRELAGRASRSPRVIVNVNAHCARVARRAQVRARGSFTNISSLTVTVRSAPAGDGVGGFVGFCGQFCILVGDDDQGGIIRCHITARGPGGDDDVQDSGFPGSRYSGDQDVAVQEQDPDGPGRLPRLPRRNPQRVTGTAGFAELGTGERLAVKIACFTRRGSPEKARTHTGNGTSPRSPPCHRCVRRLEVAINRL